MKAPDDLNISPEQGAALIERLERDACTPEDRQLLVQVLRLYFWLIFALQESKLSVKRLRLMLFGQPKPSKRRSGVSDATADAGTAGGGEAGKGATDAEGDATGVATAALSTADDTPGACEAGRTRRGHGRLGAGAYCGATVVVCRHEALAPGERCPACGYGTLYPLPPRQAIRIDGHAALSAIRYELARLRCSACGEVFAAQTPVEAGTAKYTASARAAIVMHRYFLGVPFYRLEAYQALLGVPVPDATQWEQVEHVADCAYMVFEYLVALAAQGHLIYQDDTPVRIVSLLKENAQRRDAHDHSSYTVEASERTGMYSTALVVEVGEHTICLYFSGRNHAGENLRDLLAQRDEGRAKPLVMSDALAHNEVDEAGLIRCHCLAHAQRKFRDIAETFPDACEEVMGVLKHVFEHEEAAHKAHMSDTERLAHHQTYSAPLLTTLKTWMETQFHDREVEPNSSLGKAFTYMLAHWSTLTQFLRVPAAPLDNNTAERALKLLIRQRKNSLFYHNDFSAYVGSLLTSLIATCIQAGVNAMAYLVALQDHYAAVFANPAAWLPWTFHATLAAC